MIEKINKIGNPLTIIAIFAGLAEISGTVVLPLISSDVQHIFVWFLMGFPSLLVGLFFWTLHHNHTVLYAPSDFKDDKSFFRSLTAAEKRRNLLEELRSNELESSKLIPGEMPDNEREIDSLSDLKIDLQPYAKAEEYGIREIVAENPGFAVSENVEISSPNEDAVFDAILVAPSKLIGVEIKFLKEPIISPFLLNSLALKVRVLKDIVKYSEGYVYSDLIVGFVTAFEGVKQIEFMREFDAALKQRKLNIRRRFIAFSELEAKYGGKP